MALPTLTRHGVRFRGPSLTRQGRRALSDAGVSLLERREADGWGRQLVEYVVIVDAVNPGDAIARVRVAVSPHGSYFDFAPDPE